MASPLFREIVKRGASAVRGLGTRLASRALAWLRGLVADAARGATRAVDRATQASSRRLGDVSSEAIDSVSPGEIGRMVFFSYDPKHKKTLPYYDRYPLVIVTDMRPDGFLGLNLHYLPPMLRASLLDALWSYAGEGSDESTRLEISYQILKATSRSRWYKPCVKEYLSGHVRSQIRVISPADWDNAIFLPLARFEKERQEVVWQESIRRA